MKRPSFQFYPADWRKDPGVQALPYHDRGVWFEIICLLHESEERGKLLLNGRPMPDDALARLLGLDKQKLNQTLSILIEFGVAQRCDETGALMNRRMVRDEALSKIRAESGKKGGNPVLLNQNHKQKTTTQLNQNPTPSSSSSSSTSLEVDSHTARAPISLEKAIAYGREIGCSEEVVRNWHNTRSRDGWLIHGSTGTARPVMSWQHDLATAKSWRTASNGANATDHRAERKAREYAEPKVKLPRLT